jgi:hypothetical protein
VNSAFSRVSRLVLLAAAAHCCVNAHGQQSVQPGFYSHEPDQVDIRISNARSGEVCGKTLDEAHVCTTATMITVTDSDSCKGSDGEQYPCTRYGYQFDYSGALPGESIQCTGTRKDAFRSQSFDYVLEIDGENGSIVYPLWIPYQPVEQRLMLTDVHRCTYRDAPLANIEFIVTYEPGESDATVAEVVPDASPSTDIDEPYLPEIPGACSYLTEALAAELLLVESVRRTGSNEHIPNLMSQCNYSGQAAANRNVTLLFKYMPYEMFDVETLHPAQLAFNAAASAGGQSPSEAINGLGKTAFVFEMPGRTGLMIITGIQGPMDGAGRASELIASYVLADSVTPHEERLAKLRDLGEKHVRDWHSQ